MTLLKIDEHTSKLEELDVEGILAFAERVLPRTADLWVQASLDQRQRLQQLFFPQGVAFDGSGFVGTAVTAPAFSYLQPVGDGKERIVDRTMCEMEPQLLRNTRSHGQLKVIASCDSRKERTMADLRTLTLG